MKDFFNVTPLETVFGYINRFPRADVESIDIVSATGRIAAEDIRAPEDIPGFARAAMGGIAVAVAFLSSSADAGLGICAAARALDLDFIPVITESCDLLIPANVFDSDIIRLLMEIIRSEKFKSRVRSLGGYHTDHTCKILWSC